MIYATPRPTKALRAQLAELDRLRAALGDRVKTRSRWMGSLRREIRASSIESSTAIEGYSVSPGEALALTSGRGSQAADRAGENQEAVRCYARAMDHVGTMALDPVFRWLDRVILDLHFDACYFQPEADPGLWRTGPILVGARDGTVSYRGPEGAEVVRLMGEVVKWLAKGDTEADIFVRAAMAHLHLVSVHPFRDGNGRVSRIVQSLVLAQAGLASPEFFSIEDYLGAHTDAYYAALRDAQGGSYQPDRDASGWVAFCVEAHIAQARQRLGQIERAASRWGLLERLAAERGWPDRLVVALELSLASGAERGAYAEEAEVSAATASTDFRRLLEAGLVTQRGRGRNIKYVASDELRDRVAREASG
jgi:Fic family protein